MSACFVSEPNERISMTFDVMYLYQWKYFNFGLYCSHTHENLYMKPQYRFIDTGKWVNCSLLLRNTKFASVLVSQWKSDR